MNYVGGKFKLLKLLFLYFPNKINTFVDLFGGGGNVLVNVPAQHVIYNDIQKNVVEFLEYISNNNIQSMLDEIDEYISKYSLSKQNQDGYINLRMDYNLNDKTPMKFYTLLCYAFNNQIRFNRNNDYNMPFGRNRSSFNPTLREKFITFSQRLQEIDCCFINKSFNEFDFSDFDSNDLVYCDPPYLNSVATYNENNGWAERQEIELLDLLDKLNSMNVRFALSNNLKYQNNILDNWRTKYITHFLNHDYSNCNYHKKDKTKDIEVLITNY